MGRARRDTVADHSGSREGRPLLGGDVRRAVGRAVRPWHARGLRGDVLGRRRNRAVDPRHRTGSGVAGRQRHTRTTRRMAAADVRHCRRSQGRVILLVRTGCGVRRRRDPHPRALRRSHRRVGPQRHQDLGDQRRHRRGAHRRRLCAPRARHAWAGDVHHSAEHPWLYARARSSSSTASAPHTPPRWCSRMSVSPAG